MCARAADGYPIVSLDGTMIGDGKPGPVYAAIHRLLEEDAKKGDEEHEVL